MARITERGLSICHLFDVISDKSLRQKAQKPEIKSDTNCMYSHENLWKFVKFVSTFLDLARLNDSSNLLDKRWYSLYSQNTDQNIRIS